TIAPGTCVTSKKPIHHRIAHQKFGCGRQNSGRGSGRPTGIAGRMSSSEVDGGRPGVISPAGGRTCSSGEGSRGGGANGSLLFMVRSRWTSRRAGGGAPAPALRPRPARPPPPSPAQHSPHTRTPPPFAKKNTHRGVPPGAPPLIFHHPPQTPQRRQRQAPPPAAPPRRAARRQHRPQPQWRQPHQPARSVAPAAVV